MSSILFEIKNGVAYITLNRPDKFNSFNREMALLMQAKLDEAASLHEVRCIYITGSGKAFSAGQDITEMKQNAGDVSYAGHLEKTYNPLILQIREMGKPVIAAVNGACAGAAFGIALACDLRIAHTSAYFVVGFSGIALAPDSGVSLFLPKYIGLARAQEYFYTNKPIPARLGYEWGLVNKVGGFNYQRMTRQVAEELARGPREAFAAGKKAFNAAILPNLAESLTREGILQEVLGRSDDHQGAVRAFLEKRKPEFD